MTKTPTQQRDSNSGGDVRRQRRPSFGLCPWEFALLLVLARKGAIGAFQMEILQELAAPFQVMLLKEDQQIAAQIIQNSRNFYSGFDKLITDIRPALVRIERNKGKHPRVYITKDGERVVAKTIERHSDAHDVEWLMRKHEENRASGKHWRLVSYGHLEEMNLSLKSNSR